MEANDDADQHSRIEKMELFAKEIGIESTVVVCFFFENDFF